MLRSCAKESQQCSHYIALFRPAGCYRSPLGGRDGSICLRAVRPSVDGCIPASRRGARARRRAMSRGAGSRLTREVVMNRFLALRVASRAMRLIVLVLALALVV